MALLAGLHMLLVRADGPNQRSRLPWVSENLLSIGFLFAVKKRSIPGTFALIEPKRSESISRNDNSAPYVSFHEISNAGTPALLIAGSAAMVLALTAAKANAVETNSPYATMTPSQAPQPAIKRGERRMRGRGRSIAGRATILARVRSQAQRPCTV
jgi:hypothetical protein